MNAARRCSPLILLTCAALASACSPVTVKKGLPGAPGDWFGTDAGPDDDSDGSTPDPVKPPSTDEGGSCDKALDITKAVGGLYYTGLAAGRGNDSGSCSAAGEAAKGYYAVQVTEPGNYALFADPLAGYDDPKFAQASMFMRTRCGDAKSELACSNTGTRELSVGFTEPTTVYVVVDGDVFAQAPFDLGFSQVDACTKNEDCKGFASEHCNASGICAQAGGDIGGPVDPVDPVTPIPCEGSMHECDGDPANGCETDWANDGGNCGACGNSCHPESGGGYGYCDNGACVLSCSEDFVDCDDTLKNGCETYTTRDDQNCGGCGIVCATEEPNSESHCADGMCGNSCAYGYLDCNGEPADGCECGAGPHAVAACDGTVCKPACVDYQNVAECDGDPSTGCETETAWNDQHCGGCSPCADGQVCVASVCRAATSVVVDLGEARVSALIAGADALYWLESGANCTGRLMKQPYGAAAQPLATALCNPHSLASDQDALYFSTRSSTDSYADLLLMRVEKASGESSQLTSFAYGELSYGGLEEITSVGDSLYLVAYDSNNWPFIYKLPKSGGDRTRVERADAKRPYARSLLSLGGKLLEADWPTIMTPNADGKLETSCDMNVSELYADGDGFLTVSDGQIQRVAASCEVLQTYSLGSEYAAAFAGPHDNVAYYVTSFSERQQIIALDLATSKLTPMAKPEAKLWFLAAGPDAIYAASDQQIIRVPYQSASE
jgi:hypothetical protein